MRINLLGQVTVLADSTGTDLVANLKPLDRLFLASVALAGGETVVMDRLEAQLWGPDSLPADPRGRLHNCANHVRTALRGVSTRPEVLRTGAGGYRLDVPRDAVDALRFRAKAVEARAQAGRDDTLAVSLARAALREWGEQRESLYGGEPLAGLAGEWAGNSRYRLRREHRDALTGLIEAELRRGHAESVLADFAGLADADEAGKEDEQFTALLMHAYYLRGRQSEALKTYRRTAESLQGKGFEAGRELRMMEKKIKNQDPSLDYPQESPVIPGELMPIPKEDVASPGGDTSDTDDHPAEAPARAAQAKGRRTQGPTYSQHNVGRTVVANQGTQHVNLGGSDE